MKKKGRFLRNFIILFLLGVIGYSGYYVYNDTDVFIIKDVSVAGNLRIADEDIISYLLDSELHYFETNAYDLNEKLERYPRVKDGMVKKVFPDRIEVTLTERIPVIAVNYSEQYLLIDDEFVVVDVTNDPGDYYLIEGYKFESYYLGIEIKHDERLILERAMDLAFLVMNYSELDRPPIRIKDNHILLYISEKLIADFGDGDNIEERFNSMALVYEAALENGLESGIINVSHDGYPGIKPFKEY